MTTNYVTIPLFEDAFYSYSISLEGNSYILEFVYNERASLYFLNLYTSEQEPLVLGEALVPTYPIFIDYTLPNLTGWFYLQEKASASSEPYKEFPDKIHEFYDFFYSYVTED